MKVHVTIALFKGLLDEVHAYQSEKSAQNMETVWLEKMGIKDEISREAKFGEGTEFHIVETELNK